MAAPPVLHWTAILKGHIKAPIYVATYIVATYEFSDMTDNRGILANFIHLSRGLNTAFDARLKGMELTTSRGRILYCLALNPAGVSQAEVTDYLRVEHPTTVRLLDGLENQGYVKRLPDPNDRRAKIIVLTDEGRPLADKVVTMTKELNATAIQGIAPEALETTNAVIDKLLINIIAFGEGRPAPSDIEEEA